MAQTHFLPVGIGWRRRTRAHWATDPSGDLIVFVHGFNGDAVASWLQFPTMLGAIDGAQRADILYFGYDGLTTRICNSSALLYKLIDELCAAPSQYMGRSIGKINQRDASFRYRKIVLVAHSMGAILCRRMLLDARNSQAPWVNDARLLLFAPAHCGAVVHELVTGVLGAFKLTAIEPLAKWKFSILNDAPRDSDTITTLRADTTTALATGTANYLKARAVVVPLNDDVVHAGAFGQDPTPIIVDGATHSSVCKPRPGYRKPVDVLSEVLK